MTSGRLLMQSRKILFKCSLHFILKIVGVFFIYKGSYEVSIYYSVDSGKANFLLWFASHPEYSRILESDDCIRLIGGLCVVYS